MKVQTFLLIGVLSLAAGAGTVQAQIGVGPNFEGTIMITTPEGKVVMLDAGNKVPAISLQSTLEVFQGKMSIQLEAGDTASIGCLGQTGSVAGPASVEVECGEKQGKIKVIKGEVNFEDSKVTEGNEKILTLEGKQAPATAAGEETGTGTNLGIPPVDSRSIESSPSQ